MDKYPRLKRAAAIATVIAFTGCATQPANVQATYVSSMKYDGADCKQLAREAEEIDVRLHAVTGTLQTKANTDAAIVTVGVILFWPALFALGATGGKPEEAELGHLKGEAEALARAAKAKGCDLGLPAPGIVPASAPETPAKTVSTFR